MILVENALRVAAINAVGDFVLFLGKVRGAAGILEGFRVVPIHCYRIRSTFQPLDD